LRRRLSESRVRENRMHGLMRRLRVADFAALALLYWTNSFFDCSNMLHYEWIRIGKRC
jgi:hypothetical protein